MAEKFKSKALEANLAETRYKDIKIKPEYQRFINLSNKYFGIHKRANDCIVEYQHPFSNRKFVAEELRKILLTDYWYYIGLDSAENAFKIPLKLLSNLLIEKESSDFHVMIIKTILEFVQKLNNEKGDFTSTIETCCIAIRGGLNADPLSYIIASKYFNRYLTGLANNDNFKDQILLTNIIIYRKNIEYWKNTTTIEDWITDNSNIIGDKKNVIIDTLGKPWFVGLSNKLDNIDNWQTLVSELPDYDMIANRFATSVSLFDTFIEKFYYSFYLLKLDGMASHKERIIWNLNTMLKQTIDEVDKNNIIDFIDQIFTFCAGLRKDHTSSVLDILLTLGKKVVDIDDSVDCKLIRYFENKIINFGFY